MISTKLQIVTMNSGDISFNYAPIGYFDVTVPAKTPLVLRLNIHYYVTGLTSVRADVGIVVKASDTSLTTGDDYTQTKCCVWRKGDKNYVTPQVDFSIPFRNEVGFNTGAWITIKNDDKIAFYANRIKYYATCKIITNGITNTISLYSVNSSKNGWLDLLDKLQLHDMIKITNEVKPVDKPKVEPKVEPADKPEAKKSQRKEVKIELLLKPIKYMGVECWEIPAKLGSNITITIDKPIDPTWKLCILNNANTMSSFAINVDKNEKSCFVVSYGYRKFWIIDADNNVVDFDVIKAEPI